MANPFGKKQQGAGAGAGIPGLGNMGGMGGLGNMVQQVQKKMMEDAEKMNERLETTRIETSAGGGTVKATVDGNGQLIAISIQPEALEEKDVEMLQDLILTAMKSAWEKAADLRAEEQDKIIPSQFRGLLG